MPLVEIKDFIALIDNKTCFVHPVKNKLEAYEKLIEKSRSHVYTRGYLLDNLCHSKILYIHWCRFIKTSKYEYSSTN